MCFFHSVLIEQWIRAKYERKEFLDGSRQSYISGHKDGMLWKQGKASSKFALRRFVLSETDNSLVYFNKPHVSTILPVFCCGEEEEYTSNGGFRLSRFVPSVL